MRVSWPRTGLSIGFLERASGSPLRSRPHDFVAADLVEPPEQFELMAVGIRELDRNLRAGSPPAVKIDRDVVLLQMLPHPQQLVERRHFKRQVVQFDILGAVGHRADKANAVMIGVEAHEHHAAGHHLRLVDVRNLEPENLRVELHGSLKIAAVQDHMSDLRDRERNVGCRWQRLDLLRDGLVVHVVLPIAFKLLFSVDVRCQPGCRADVSAIASTCSMSSWLTPRMRAGVDLKRKGGCFGAQLPPRGRQEHVVDAPVLPGAPTRRPAPRPPARSTRRRRRRD